MKIPGFKYASFQWYTVCVVVVQSVWLVDNLVSLLSAAGAEPGLSDLPASKQQSGEWHKIVTDKILDYLHYSSNVVPV